MYINISEIGSPEVLARLKEEQKQVSSDPEIYNVYVHSDDAFARKIIHEVNMTSLNILAQVKGMSVPQFCEYLSTAVVSSFDAVSRAFIGSIFALKEKKIPTDFISEELKTTSEKIDKIAVNAEILILAEQLENEEIIAEITERAKKYGGIDAMMNTPGIPAEEVYRELGISDVDLSKVEDVEID